MSAVKPGLTVIFMRLQNSIESCVVVSEIFYSCGLNRDFFYTPRR